MTGIPGCLLLWGPQWETAGLQWVPSSHFPFISYIDHHPQRDDRNSGTDINSTIQNKFVHLPRALSNTVQKIKERPGQLHPSFLSDLFLPSLSELLTMFYIIFQDKHPRQKKKFLYEHFYWIEPEQASWQRGAPGARVLGAAIPLAEWTPTRGHQAVLPLCPLCRQHSPFLSQQIQFMAFYFSRMALEGNQAPRSGHLKRSLWSTVVSTWMRKLKLCFDFMTLISLSLSQQLFIECETTFQARCWAVGVGEQIRQWNACLCAVSHLAHRLRFHHHLSMWLWNWRGRHLLTESFIGWRRQCRPRVPAVLRKA